MRILETTRISESNLKFIKTNKWLIKDESFPNLPFIFNTSSQQFQTIKITIFLYLDRDFKTAFSLDDPEQINRIILQATSLGNLCQCNIVILDGVFMTQV